MEGWHKTTVDGAFVHVPFELGEFRVLAPSTVRWPQSCSPSPLTNADRLLPPSSPSPLSHHAGYECRADAAPVWRWWWWWSAGMSSRALLLAACPPPRRAPDFVAPTEARRISHAAIFAHLSPCKTRALGISDIFPSRAHQPRPRWQSSRPASATLRRRRAALRWR